MKKIISGMFAVLGLTVITVWAAPDELGIRTFDSKTYAIKAIVAADKANDICIMRVEAKGLKPAPIAHNVNVGASVVSIGHPVKHLYTMTEGVVSGKYLRKNSKGVETRELNITADFAKGSSGGPVFDMTGSVVGMVRSTSSVYYDKKDGIDSNLQMVWKQCVPSIAINELISGEGVEDLSTSREL